MADQTASPRLTPKFGPEVASIVEECSDRELHPAAALLRGRPPRAVVIARPRGARVHAW